MEHQLNEFEIINKFVFYSFLLTTIKKITYTLLFSFVWFASWISLKIITTTIVTDPA